MRTNAPDVFVAGDIANPLYGRQTRVEHWANALVGGQIAARTMLERTSAFDPAPFFFTDQYDIGMEYAGWVATGGADEPVVRGDLDAHAFHAFWLTADDVVVAGMHVNQWDEGIAPVQNLIRAQVRVDRDRLANTSDYLRKVAGGVTGLELSPW